MSVIGSKWKIIKTFNPKIKFFSGEIITPTHNSWLMYSQLEKMIQIPKAALSNVVLENGALRKKYQTKFM